MSKEVPIVKNTAKAGISFGTCLAMVISYTQWHSSSRSGVPPVLEL